MKKKISKAVLSIALFMTICFLAATPVLTQEPQINWVNGEGGISADQSLSTIADGDGNCIITGNYSNTVVFGAGEANETVLSCQGRTDLFLAKYDADGNLLWAKRAGGSGWVWCWGFDVNVDNSGNIVVTGRYDGTITFGPGEANETTLSPGGGWDIYVAKFDPDGNLLWVKSAPGWCNDLCQSVTADADGNVIVTGSIECSATFGSGGPNQTTVSGAGASDFIVAKYDADGNFLWVKKAGSSSWEQGVEIEADGSNNYYVAAYFEGTVVFGAGEANETTLSSHGAADIMIGKFDANGNLVWAKSAGGNGSDLSESIAVDASGNSYLTGYFNNTAIFGAGEANETNLTSLGGDDIFIAKYNAQGELVWARRCGGTQSDRPHAISLLGQGQVVLTGEFSGTATFGTISLTSSGDRDIFVAAIDASGNFLWAKKFGGANGDVGWGIDCANLGSIFFAGYFAGSAQFDDYTLNSTGQNDIFVGNLIFSPAEQIAFLADEIDQLVQDGVLTTKQAHKLQKNLRKANKFLEKGKTRKAIKNFKKMIKRINRWIKKGHISPEAGEALIAEINGIIDQLENGLGKRKYGGSEDATHLSENYQLQQNYPNPFNATTTIQYAIPQSERGEVDVQLNIYNVNGQIVRHLVNAQQSAGMHQIQWDGTDDYGEYVATGIYFYFLKAGSFIDHRKLLFVK